MPSKRINLESLTLLQEKRAQYQNTSGTNPNSSFDYSKLKEKNISNFTFQKQAAQIQEVESSFSDSTSILNERDVQSNHDIKESITSVKNILRAFPENTFRSNVNISKPGQASKYFSKDSKINLVVKQ
jgi:hypothetical protein